MFPQEEINRMELAERVARASRSRAVRAPRVAALRRRPRLRLAHLLDILRPGRAQRNPETLAR